MKKINIKILIIMLIAFILSTCIYQDSAYGKASRYNTEIIVRTIENFKNHKDVVNFFNATAKHKIGVVNLNVKQDEDDEVASGYVFYKSKIAPIAPAYKKFDALKDAISEAHKRKIKIRAWIPQFHDQAAAQKNSSWQMMYLKDGKISQFKGENNNEYFVNPVNTEVQNYEESIIKEVVSNYKVDGIVLDWLRFDNYNMDLSDYTRNKYKQKYGYDPINIDFSTSNTKRTQWNKWRTGIIGAYVRKIRSDLKKKRSGLTLGVYMLPPEFVECGQDAALFSKNVDFLSPMAYFADWGYSISWVYSKAGVLADTEKKANGKKIIPTLDSWWSDAQYKKIYSGIRKNFTKIKSISYFLYGKRTDVKLKKIETMNNKY